MSLQALIPLQSWLHEAVTPHHIIVDLAFQKAMEKKEKKLQKVKQELHQMAAERL